MSEQRRLRSELKQGLHQFLMQMYISYTQTMNENDAKELVLQVVEEEYQYFTPENKLRDGSAKEILTEKLQEFSDKMESTKDFDAQLYYAEKVETLQAALELLDYKN